MHNNKLIKSSKSNFKNKELYLWGCKTVLKVLAKNLTPPLIYKKKIYKVNSSKLFVDFNKHFKGCSLLSLKRKGFYSIFQLSRFEVKRLISERILVGVKSAIW